MPLHRSTAVLSMLFAWAAAAAASPAIAVLDRTETYEVDGVDAPALTQQMAERGPLHQGRRAWAYTDWELASRYTPVPSRDGCRIEGVHLRLEVVTTLPYWRAPPAATSRLRSRWTRLHASLLAHEQVHREHALEAARATQAALERLPPAPDCDAAASQAQDALREHVQIARRRSYEFDRATGFGTRAGVRLQDD